MLINAGILTMYTQKNIRIPTSKNANFCNTVLLSSLWHFVNLHVWCKKQMNCVHRNRCSFKVPRKLSGRSFNIKNYRAANVYPYKVFITESQHPSAIFFAGKDKNCIYKYIRGKEGETDSIFFCHIFKAHLWTNFRVYQQYN